MNAKSIAKKINQLEEEVRKHQFLYYVKNQPVISDQEFDFMFKELQDLEKKYPEFVSPNSPTMIIGSDLDNRFTKFTHKISVLSLTNTYSINEMIEWVEKTGSDYEYSVEWKVDGASIVLYYKNGELEHGVTRGTGGVGDDVTENIRTIKNVPLRLAKPATIYLRGEVYMNFSDFEYFNQEAGNIYANPRNLAAGSLKNKYSSETSKRPLKVFTYDAYFPDENKKEFKSHGEIISELTRLNLPVLPDLAIVKGKDLAAKIREFSKIKETKNFPIDGLVIKLNDISLRNKLGVTTHSPRWARAFKFDAIMKESVIEEIDFAVGRTGKITPRARIKPVTLAGTTVQYATLHNQDYINELGVGIGARVKVAKRGEIIPAVEEVIEEAAAVFKLPDNCPSCQTKLVKIDESVDYFCPNAKCPDRMVNQIIFFCERKQMDIDGLGESQVKFLFNHKYITTIPDLYQLDKRKNDLAQEQGFGEKSVAIILNGIEKSKEKNLKVILPSLGLNEIGHKVTEILIESGYDSIDKIIDLAASKDARENIMKIHGIGPKTAEAMIANFHNKDILSMISKLKLSGLDFSAKIIRSAKTPFLNQSWCVTGSFENFQPRDIAMDLVVMHGGRKLSSITSKTTHLLLGEGGGSKIDKAMKLGARVVTEKEFLEILKNAKIEIPVSEKV